MNAADLLLQLQVNPGSGVPLAPHWGWYIVIYFFIGGITAGLYAIACTLDLLGDPRDRDAVQLGYRLAFPGIALCGLLLVLDLGQPLRLWHMLVQSNRIPRPMFKLWSPISVGTWIVAAFGAFALVSFVLVLVETGRVRQPRLLALHAWWHRTPALFRRGWLVAGALLGFGLAGYTGVLMIGTTRPVWHNAYLLGGLFLASAASTSYALLILALVRRGRPHGDPTVAKLDEAEGWSVGLEFALLAATLLWLGGLARPFVSGLYGALFWVGVVGLGLVTPVLLRLAPTAPAHAERRAMVRAVCVLVGGLCLRFVFIMAPQ